MKYLEKINGRFDAEYGGIGYFCREIIRDYREDDKSLHDFLNFKFKKTLNDGTIQEAYTFIDDEGNRKIKFIYKNPRKIIKNITKNNQLLCPIYFAREHKFDNLEEECKIKFTARFIKTDKKINDDYNTDNGHEVEQCFLYNDMIYDQDYFIIREVHRVRLVDKDGNQHKICEEEE